MHLDAATARLLDLIREFDVRGGWNNGFRSCAEWLSWRVGLDLGAAREKVRVARALATLPRLAQALAHGELSYAKVRALTRVATPETEERLLAIGRAGTAEHVERIVRGWRRMDRKAEQDEAARQHASRALYVYPAEDGTVTIRGRLAPEAGALLLKALTAAREALYQREQNRNADAQADVSAEPPTMAQQQADALVLLAETALHHGIDPGTPAEHYQVVVHVDASVLEDADQPGQSVVEDGARVLPKRLSALDATRAGWSCSTMPRVAFSRSAPRPARSRRRRGERCSIGTGAAVPRLPRTFLSSSPYPSLGPGRPHHAVEPCLALPSPPPSSPRGGLSGRSTARW